MTAMPIFKYKNCVHIKEKLVRFGHHDQSITIDAQRDFSSKKAKSFRAAYAGARLYLLSSIIIRIFKIEPIYFFIEEIFRKTKFTLNKFIQKLT